MKTPRSRSIRSRLARLPAFLAAVLHPFMPAAFGQGPINPPGAPGPAMKALDQVEPRVAINATNTPASATALYTITQSGSYYLTGNITSQGVNKNAIEVAANDVTIDLMGYEIFAGTGSVRAIKTTVNNSVNLAVRNGVIRNWNIGIDASVTDNIVVSDLRIVGFSHGAILGRSAARIRDCNIYGGGDHGILVTELAVITGCTAAGCGLTGITTGTAAVVTNCTTRFNGSTGIVVGSGSTVANATLVQNTGKGLVAADSCTIADCVALLNGGTGIAVGQGSTVRHCSSYSNTGGGDGIEIGEGTGVVDCRAYNNQGSGIAGAFNATPATITGCTVYRNSGYGIDLGAGIVSRCDASGNGVDGIRLLGSGRITENRCDGNGIVAVGAGIRVVQSECVVENNSVASNDIGIYVEGSPNVVIRNSARANTSGNYNVLAGNLLGTILTSAAAMNAANNNYGNLSF